MSSSISIAVKAGVVAAGCVAVALWLPPKDPAASVTLERIPQAPAPIRAARPAAVEAPQATLNEWATTAEPATVDGTIEAVAQIPSATTILPAAAGQPSAPAKPGNGVARRELVLNLQRELIRVGCYGGTASGTWTLSSKRAMSAFLERVNASLPVEEPDYVLLALVQHQREVVCTGGSIRAASLPQSEAPRTWDANASKLGGEELVQRPAAPRNPAPRRFTFRSAEEKGWRERVFESR